MKLRDYLGGVKRVWSKLPVYAKYYLGNYYRYIPLVWNEINGRLENMGCPCFRECRRSIIATKTIVSIGKDLNSSQKMVLKIPLNDTAYTRLMLNYQAIAFLDNRLPIKVPKPIFLFKVDPIGCVFVESFLEGSCGYDLALTYKSERGTFINEAEKVLSAITGKTLEDMNSSPDAKGEDVINMYQCSLEKSADLHKIPGFTRLIGRLYSMWRSEKIKTGLSHGDYHLANIMYSKDEQEGRWKATGVIDWDRLDFEVPVFYDKLHLHISANAVFNNTSIGRQTIDFMEMGKFDFRELLLFWLIFVSKTSKCRPEVFESRRWVKRNIINVIDYQLNMRIFY